MINFLKEKLKIRKFNSLLKSYFEPGKEFSAKTKQLFLAKVKRELAVTKQESLRISYKGFLHEGKLRGFTPVPLKIFAYSFSAVLALLAFNGAAITYAQKQNVSAGHPLYVFKRLGEEIQTAIADEEEKPFLRDKFAKLRLEEIKETKSKIEEKIDKIEKEKNEKIAEIEKQINRNLERENNVGEVNLLEDKKTEEIIQAEQRTEEAKKLLKNENEQRIRVLEKDFRNNIEAALKEAKADLAEKSAKNIKNLCDSISERIEEHKKLLPESNSGKWSNFEEKCGKIIEKEGDDGRKKEEDKGGKGEEIKTRENSQRNESGEEIKNREGKGKNETKKLDNNGESGKNKENDSDKNDSKGRDN